MIRGLLEWVVQTGRDGWLSNHSNHTFTVKQGSYLPFLDGRGFLGKQRNVEHLHHSCLIPLISYSLLANHLDYCSENVNREEVIAFNLSSVSVLRWG